MDLSTLLEFPTILGFLAWAAFVVGLLWRLHDERRRR